MLCRFLLMVQAVVLGRHPLLLLMMAFFIRQIPEIEGKIQNNFMTLVFDSINDI